MLHSNGVTESNQYKSQINHKMKEVIRRIVRDKVAEEEVVEEDEEAHSLILAIETDKTIKIM